MHREVCPLNYYLAPLSLEGTGLRVLHELKLLYLGNSIACKQGMHTTQPELMQAVGSLTSLNLPIDPPSCKFTR